MQDSTSRIGSDQNATVRLDLDGAAAELAAVVSRLVADWASGRAPDGFRRFGVGAQEIDDAMASIEPIVRQSVWNMQQVFAFDPASSAMELTERTRTRDLDLRLLTTQRSLELYPLITSEIPEVRFGPARSHVSRWAPRTQPSRGSWGFRCARSRQTSPM